jgi:polyphosphate:AMP phosphotransferase
MTHLLKTLETGQPVSKSAWKEASATLRQQLLDAQHRLLQSGRSSLLILVHGVDGAGRGETVNLFNEWMDPRHIRTEAFGPLSAIERQRPPMWRYWQVLPPKGHIGVLYGSWYSDPIASQMTDTDAPEGLLHRLAYIRRFEQMLVSEGVVLLKFWFHLSKKAARERMKLLASDPRTAWRVTEQERERLQHHEAFVQAAEDVMAATHTDAAPWHLIDGADPAFRSLAASRHVLAALEHMLAMPPRMAAQPESLVESGASVSQTQPNRLFWSDANRTLKRKTYDEELERLQGRLALLSRDPRMQQRSLVLVFEGMDAAGKGSTIRRLTHAWDARFYRVVPVAAPNENERAQPYLWRFWRYIPPHGKAVIFDRSWYGRVLVERAEGYCSPVDWQRAYDEINAYEEELSQSGAVIVKFWLAISPEEQLKRFKAREVTPHKNYKITEDDWRNREKWPLYERAVEQMVDRTSTRMAPWHIVASDDKLWSRIEVLRLLCERLEGALDEVPAKN